MTEQSQHPQLLAMNHVGLTVEDLDSAVAWYTEVVGFRLIYGPLTISANDETTARKFRDFFGERWQEMRQAHLSTANGTGLELFEFQSPITESRSNKFE